MLSSRLTRPSTRFRLMISAAFATLPNAVTPQPSSSWEFGTPPVKVFLLTKASLQNGFANPLNKGTLTLSSTSD